MNIKIVDYHPRYLKSIKELFQKSDLYWPGSLFQGITLSTKNIIEYIGSQDIKFLLLAVNPTKNKVLGYLEYTTHPEKYHTGYISLLNVHPEYLRQGIGKQLLEKAISKTVKLGYSRLDLHSCSGNFRAIPLYKKLGFAWINEGKSTKLENYMPLILNFPPFKQLFFEKKWQDMLLPRSELEEDHHPTVNNDILTYKFRDNRSQFEVLLDRKAKGISGFKTKNFNCKVDIDLLENNTKQFSANLTINKSNVNISESEILTSTSVKESKYTHLFTPRKHIVKNKVNNHDIKELNTDFLIEKPDTNTTQCQDINITQTTKIKIDNGAPFNLTTHKTLKAPLEINLTPNPILNLQPNKQTISYLEIKNNHSYIREIHLQIQSSKDIDLYLKNNRHYITKKSDNTISITLLTKNKSTISLPLIISGKDPGLKELTVTASTTPRLLGVWSNCKFNRTFTLPVFNDNSTVVNYTTSSSFRLETSKLLLEVDKTTGGYTLYDKELVQLKENTQDGILLQGSPVKMGPPFWPHEFDKLTPQGYIDSDTITLIFDSKNSPGVQVATHLKLLATGELVKWASCTNHTQNNQSFDLQIKTKVPKHPNMKIIAPLTDGPLIEDYLPGSFPVPKLDFPDAKNKFRDNYYIISCQEKEIICEFPKDTHFSLGDNYLPIIKDRITLKPGQKRISQSLTYHVKSKKRNQLVNGSLHRSGEIRLTPEVKTVITSPRSLQCYLKLRRQKPFTGIYHIFNDDNELIKTKKLSISHTEKPIEKITIPAEKQFSACAKSYTIQLVGDRKQSFLFPVIRLGNNKYNVSIEQKNDKVHINNGTISYNIAPNFAGSIIKLQDKDKNLLYSTYPDKKSFSWFRPFLGGITPFIHTINEDLSQKQLLNVTPTTNQATINLLQRTFQGSTFDYYLSDSKLILSVQYYTLPKSNLLYCLLKVTNLNSKVEEINFGTMVSLNINNEQGEFHPLDKDPFIFPRTYPKTYLTKDFCSIKTPNKALALLAFGHKITLIDSASDGNVISVNNTKVIEPNTTKSLQLLLAFTNTIQEANIYKHLLWKMF
ncbi:GNAT family N-acetyltransferase [Natranaerobius trueperi]|uniref:N-acetyltransferase domain-containing protein n=1 Tax=Natranaerobius trueperi TaxID=759412 RepID=A0A226C1N0_9FIRM|nr:GNAT family N-acetyltransferase [Natranaerobius trueperi]OWZ84952.1 hypothetical protein CDO51_00670 [Natranaerobius trueperi]